jgi:hypothetical protein
VGPSNESPVKGKDSNISPPSGIQYILAGNQLNVGSNGFTTGHSRRKRAAGSTFTFYIRRNVGKLTNPSTGVSGASITVVVGLIIISTTQSCGGHIGFTGILSFYGSLPRFQLEDGSDQMARWIDFKFADYVDLTPI